MKILSILTYSILLLFFVGCSVNNQPIEKKYEFSLSSSNEFKNKKLFEVSLEPSVSYIDVKYREKALNAFMLIVDNKTNNEIKIIWDETYFISGGKLDGRFMFSGIKYTDREKSNLPSLILPKSKFVEHIYPNSKVEFERHELLGTYDWAHKEIFEFETPTGIYLTVEIKGKKYKEKVLYDFKSINKIEN